MKKESSRQHIALKRIETLFEQALIRPAFAKRYVVLARRMSSRHKVPIPRKWKRRFCKSCSAFWTPGKNCTVRVRMKRIVMTCECGAVRRFPVNIS